MEIVKRLVKEGLNKKDIFEKATKEGLNPIKVSKYLAMYPDPEESQKYHNENNVLIGIYSVAILFSGIAILASNFSDMGSEVPFGAVVLGLAIGLLICGFVINSIYKKQSFGYLVLCFFLFKGILSSFKGYEANSEDNWTILIELAVNICLIVYVVKLKNKLFPYQNFFNTKKTDEGIAIFTKDISSRVSETPRSDVPS